MRGAALALLGAALVARAAVALELALPAPGTAEWQPLEFPGIPQHTRYELVEAARDVRCYPTWVVRGERHEGFLAPRSLAPGSCGRNQQ